MNEFVLTYGEKASTLPSGQIGQALQGCSKYRMLVTLVRARQEGCTDRCKVEFREFDNGAFRVKTFYHRGIPIAEVSSGIDFIRYHS